MGSAEGVASLAEELNIFFAHFEVEPSAEATTPHPTVHSSFTLTEHEVRRTLQAMDPMASHLQRVLKDCADQLVGVFTRFFNQALAQSTASPCPKSSTIVLLPKKTHISSLLHYWPVALTTVVMKCFEKLVQGHITSLLPKSLDPH